MNGPLIIRVGLAAMWSVHGLEKFGVKWPVWLGGGTQSVADMLVLMAEVTPFRYLQALIEQILLPGAHILQYPVGVLEIGLAVLLTRGLWLPYAALVGAAMQAFFWLGFFTVEWPLGYPLVMLMHLALAAPLLLPKAFPQPRALLLVRLALAAVWLYHGLQESPAYLLLGAPLLAGAAARILALPALALILVLALREGWGSWPWVYYLVAASHLATAVPDRPKPAAVQT